MEKTSH